VTTVYKQQYITSV